MFTAQAHDPYDLKVPSRTNLTVDVNIKRKLTIENIYIYIYLGHVCGWKKDKSRTTWSYIDDWHRVLDASTFLRTWWSLSDNMTSCLSPVHTIYELSRTSVRWIKWMTFDNNLAVSYRTESVSTCVRRKVQERPFANTDRFPMTCPVYKANNHDRRKKEGHIHEEVDYTRDDHKEKEFYRQRNPKTHLTIFDVTAGMYIKAFRSVSCVAKNTGTVVIDDVDLSSDASLSTDRTYCIRYLMKKDTLSSAKKNKV